MKMNLANFFDAVDSLVPVAPLPIDVSLTCTKDMFPNGRPNPGGRPVRARGKACIVALDAREIILTRSRARKLLASIVASTIDAETKLPAITDDVDLELALRFEQAASFLREWDPVQRVAGPQLFSSGEIAFELLTFDEVNRLMKAYNDYMRDEHPAEVDPSTRDKSAAPGRRVAPAPPR